MTFKNNYTFSLAVIHSITFFLLLSLGLGVISCKNKHSSKSLNKQSNSGIQGVSIKPVDDGKTIFLGKVDSNSFKFKSFSAKGSLSFDQNGNSRSADINIRIKRDEIIWFYVNLSIIPVAQGYITPTDIKIKNLLSGEYTHKNFEFLRELTGIPVNFQDLQSILVGNKLLTGKEDSSTLKVTNLGEFIWESMSKPIINRFAFNAQYRPMTIDLRDSVHSKKLNLQYSNFIPQNGSSLPQSIQILAHSDNNNLTIQMDYRKVQVDLDQDYPFHSPDESK